MSEAITLQVEKEKAETVSFIEILKNLSELEKAEVRGYMNCLVSVKFLASSDKLNGADCTSIQKEQKE